MSRPLRLDTQEDRRQRYSFIETPLEMHAAPQFPDTSPRPATASHAQESGIVQQQQHTAHDVSHQQAHRYSSNEKERKLQDEGIIPTYSRVPPLEQHPALYAPVVEDLQQPECVQSPHFSRSFSSPQPGSPVPRTVKKDPESPKRSETTAIAPDANPLQSPKSPYFPPPARTTQQAPAIDDWSASHQPGQVMHPDQEVRGGTWSHGLCDSCSNIGVCCLGAICPCILYGKTQYRLSMKSRKESPTNMLGYETCNGSCAAMALLCGCQWLLATIQHTRTRKAYGIKGDVASDCVRATCCTCCTLIQDETEIQTREEQRGRAALERGATLVSPYTAPGPMAYPPPPK